MTPSAALLRCSAGAELWTSDELVLLGPDCDAMLICTCIFLGVLYYLLYILCFPLLKAFFLHLYILFTTDLEEQAQELQDVYSVLN